MELLKFIGTVYELIQLKGVIMSNQLKTSKKLSFLLRHSQEPLYISLVGGWANVTTILKTLQISRLELEQIVAEDQKTRYSFDESGTKIRANQGHSIPGVQIAFASPEPPEYLYHGTATRFLDSIMKDGLKPMTRQWVHISPDYETAVKVGARHGKPIVLRVKAKAFTIEGNELYLSENGVWLAKAVPSVYLEIFCPEGAEM